MSPDRIIYVLDSFALLAYLNDEPGKQRVQEILESARQSRCRACLCMINLGEVLYTTERLRSLAQAQQVLALIENLPLELLDAKRDLVLDAAHIKAHHALSYADAFVVAAACREHAVILTGDPDFKSVASLVQIEWLEEKT